MKKLYITRDADGYLALWIGKPTKSECDSIWKGYSCRWIPMTIDEELYQEVKWEDEEPAEVELIIKKKTTQEKTQPAHMG